MWLRRTLYNRRLQIADCGLHTRAASRTAYNIRSRACQLDVTTPQHNDGTQQDVPHRADGQQQTVFQPQSTLFHPAMSRSMVRHVDLQAPPLLDYHCHGTTSECSTAKVNPTLTTIVLSPALNAANTDSSAGELLRSMDRHAQCAEIGQFGHYSGVGRAHLATFFSGRSAQRS